MSVREIAGAYGDGTITGDTYVWTDGFADWKPLSEVPELLEAVQTSSASRAPKPSPWDARGGAQRAAARASSSRSPTADLFGGIDTAGSEDEVATSAPDQHHGNSHGGSSSTGARNESSVLFSLSALTSAANARPSNRPTSSASRDDSGLIDLKALTAAAMKSDTGASAPIAPAMPVAPLAPLGVAPPLGLASPLGGGITATTDIGIGGYPQPKSKAPLYIGGGIAIGMIALAAAIALRPAPPPPPAPIVVAAPPPPAPVPSPAPAPTQEAKPPTTAGAEDPEPPKATAPQANNARPVRRSPPPSGGAQKPAPKEDSPKPASTPPPKKSSGGCGCAGGDLQCAMRCAAKGG